MNQIPSRPAPTKSFRLFGCRVDRVSASDIYARVGVAFTEKSFLHIVTGNALMLMEARRSSVLRCALEEADLVTIESSGLSAASLIYRGPKIERVAGIDLAFQLCQMAAQNNVSVFLLGGRPGVAEAARTALGKQVPGLAITGVRDGFFAKDEEGEVLDALRSASAGLVLVALGMPRQELWIFQNKNSLPPAVFMGVGGSFDVWSGRVDRAPRFLQRLGAEWFYRLVKEPFRIGRMLKLPLFAFLVVFERIFRGETRR